MLTGSPIVHKSSGKQLKLIGLVLTLSLEASSHGEPSTEKHFEDPYSGAGCVKRNVLDIFSHLFPLNLESSKAV